MLLDVWLCTERFNEREKQGMFRTQHTGCLSFSYDKHVPECIKKRQAVCSEVLLCCFYLICFLVVLQVFVSVLFLFYLFFFLCSLIDCIISIYIILAQDNCREIRGTLASKKKRRKKGFT